MLGKEMIVGEGTLSLKMQEKKANMWRLSSSSLMYYRRRRKLQDDDGGWGWLAVIGR
jgi:hypothetical protein